MPELSTYEIITLGLTCATILLAVVSIIIAIRSARSSSEAAQRQIAEMNRDTRLNISVEQAKLEVEGFRITMRMMELKAEKDRLLSKPEQLDIPCYTGPNNRERIKLIDAELDRCDRLFHKIGFTKLDMQQAISNLKNESNK